MKNELVTGLKYIVYEVERRAKSAKEWWRQRDVLHELAQEEKIKGRRENAQVWLRRPDTDRFGKTRVCIQQ